MSPWMVLALAIIVGGGLAILRRLHLLVIAVTFWLTFAAAIGVLALTGHAMTASWHVGPITGAYFWWVLVTSPEILVFLFFMITDPKTIPSGRRARMVYAAAIALLAALLIAPAQTEFWAKVAVLGSLAIVCAVRPVLGRLPAFRLEPRRLAAAAAVVLVGYTAAVAVAGIRARPEPRRAAARAHGPTAADRDPPLARRGNRARPEDRSSDRRRPGRQPRPPGEGAVGSAAERPRPGGDRRRAHPADEADPRCLGGTIETAASRLERMRVWLEAGHGQGPAIAVVTLDGTRQLTAYKDVPPVVVRRDPAVSFRETLELQNDRGRWLVARVRSGRPVAVVPAPQESAAMRRAAAAGFAGVRLTDVAKQVGLDFRQDAFRFGVSADTPAMMGGGLCWLDYDNDGWLDLFVVNNFAESDIGAWDRRGGLPAACSSGTFTGAS